MSELAGPDRRQLADELVALAMVDHAVRTELADTGELFDGYHPEMRAVHERNADRLAEIVEAHGWPGRRLVGEAASRAAWLVLQHAISRPALLRSMVPVLGTALVHGDVDAAELAHLVDRVRFHEGRPQVYGTQLDWDERGVLSAWPVDDEARVDERRAAVGLGPLAEAVAAARVGIAATREEPPVDLARRRAEMATFAVEVGWT